MDTHRPRHSTTRVHPRQRSGLEAAPDADIQALRDVGVITLHVLKYAEYPGRALCFGLARPPLASPGCFWKL